MPKSFVVSGARIANVMYMENEQNPLSKSQDQDVLAPYPTHLCHAHISVLSWCDHFKCKESIPVSTSENDRVQEIEHSRRALGLHFTQFDGCG